MPVFPRFLLAVTAALAFGAGCSAAPDATEAGADDELDQAASRPVPEIALGEVVRDMLSRHGEGTVLATLDGALAKAVADPELRAQLSAQLRTYVRAVADGNVPEGTFPMVPLAAVGLAQRAIAGAQPSAPPASSAAPVLDLSKSLASMDRRECTPQRPALTAVPNGLGLQTGGVADPSLDDCALFRTQRLAAVLNALAVEQPGAALVDGAQRATTFDDAVQLLEASGHTIRVYNRRFFANFIGLYYQGKSVKAPVWIDTGMPLPEGGTLRLPAPHAGFTITFAGSKVRGEMEFFLGVDDGTSFRPIASLHRPTWSGGRTLYSYSSKTNRAKVEDTLSVAAALRRRWQAEGRAMPLQGYGQLGVCNDSVGAIEAAVEGGEPTLFPFARSLPTGTASTAPHDARLVDAIDGLPRDARDFDPMGDVADALRRIRLTMPMSDTALRKHHPFVAGELEQLR